MANNHQGSVAHAKRIIDEFGALAKEKNIKAAIKLQFRQLDTFIHDDFKDSDLKFVKRFRSTRLSKEQFREIVEHTRQSGLIPMATPFDNESLHWFEDLKVPVVKVASCSIDDWVLFEELSNINKRIIIFLGSKNYKICSQILKLAYQRMNRQNKKVCVVMLLRWAVRLWKNMLVFEQKRLN